MKGNDLLIEIIRERKKEIADNHIFRNNCLYYTKKEINIGELSTILNKKKEKVFDYF